MALETEAVLDRRALKRRAGAWRALAIVAGALAVGALAYAADIGTSTPRHIARVTIDGMITDDRRQLQMLKRIAASKTTEAVILAINSTGGTTTGGEALYETIRELAAKKPVVAQFGTVAASAAYIAGLAADHIVARGNTITGSVGVIFQYPEISALLDKVGVKMNEVRSGPLKAVPSIFEPASPEAKKVTEALVADSQGWFLDLVKTRRNIDTAAVPGLEQGRIFSGREALKFRLVDSIGGEAEALRWLETQHRISVKTRVIDWKPRGDGVTGFGRIFGIAGRALGIDESTLSTLQTTAAATGALALDGLVSVWQPHEK